MYRKILVALDNSPSDAAVLPHVTELAGIHGSALVLVHVADGFAARNFDQLDLAESQEMKDDRDYLERAADEMRARGLQVQTTLQLGDPVSGILQAAKDCSCDLIAMTTHGHGL